ncbi:hypothetical protein SKAU_G00036930 [Synaphobranchus kaupii]|uniref:Uncharacterized protein n=1 Tax=Synaphobranchus kaupii TaxID=118154 RepID=A0A9Q1GGF8_SYNKA|nr:hypothetical protein SKAU_G00036930 [Synaphobranchus kaupii]
MKGLRIHQCPEPPSIAHTHCQHYTGRCIGRQCTEPPSPISCLQCTELLEPPSSSTAAVCAPLAQLRIQWPQSTKKAEWQQFDEETVGAPDLWRVESHRRRRREKARKKTEFLANSFKLTKQLLSQKRTGRLTCSRGTINDHLKCTYSDTRRDQPLGPCNVLITPPEPTVDFNLKEPCLSEVEEVVRRARSSSAPGPSGVPYKVYNNCQKLLHWLWRALQVIWRRGEIAQSWRYAEGVYIPKEERSENIDQFHIISEERSENIDQFHIISLLSVESKIFFSVVA